VKSAHRDRRLLRLLEDPSFPRRDNVVAFLAYSRHRIHQPWGMLTGASFTASP